MSVCRFGLIVLMLVAALMVPDRALAQSAEDLTNLNKQAQEFYEAGKYVDALERQQSLVGLIVKMETGTAGGPGPATAAALSGLAWFALCARKFDVALAAAQRAHRLAPRLVWIDANRAHALLFANRVKEARALYLAHKGVKLPENADKLWEDAVIEDFGALRRIGLGNRAFGEIIAAFRQNAGTSRSLKRSQRIVSRKLSECD